MSVTAPPVLKAPSSEATLRKLFLTLFLRGHSSQGQSVKTVPTSVGKKLGLVLTIYAVFGLTSLILFRNELFVIAAYLHGMTFMMIGMFVVQSAGETLFNKDESEILLHRPILPKTLLWAKVSVLILVSLYLSLAINFFGFFGGLMASDGNWLFPIVHLASLVEEAVFSAGCVVLAYQLCLRWFGRERMENIMTTLQVVVIAGFVIGSQVVPRVLVNNALEGKGAVARPWWLAVIPPGWFARLDDAVAGSHATESWWLALVGLGVTAAVAWLAFGKLAKGYESGVQALNEAPAAKESQARQLQFLTWLARKTVLSFWLKDSVGRVSFVLIAAYLWRDREVKLRVYPAMTSVVMMPIIMMVSNPSTHLHHLSHSGGALATAMNQGMNSLFANMGMAFAGGFLASTPLTALSILTYSQQWRASEVFIAAPIPGPWPIQRGAMTAVNLLLVAPMLLFLVIFSVVTRSAFALPVMLAGVLLVPLYGRLPALLLGSIPLSKPSEESKAAGRGCLTMAAPFLGLAIGGLAMLFNTFGWLYWMLLGEVFVVIAFCLVTKKHLEQAPWRIVD